MRVDLSLSESDDGTTFKAHFLITATSEEGNEFVNNFDPGFAQAFVSRLGDLIEYYLRHGYAMPSPDSYSQYSTKANKI